MNKVSLIGEVSSILKRGCEIRQEQCDTMFLKLQVNSKVCYYIYVIIPQHVMEKRNIKKGDFVKIEGKIMNSECDVLCTSICLQKLFPYPYTNDVHLEAELVHLIIERHYQKSYRIDFILKVQGTKLMCSAWNEEAKKIKEIIGQQKKDKKQWGKEERKIVLLKCIIMSRVYYEDGQRKKTKHLQVIEEKE